jgi:hypothetical protein
MVFDAEAALPAKIAPSESKFGAQIQIPPFAADPRKAFLHSRGAAHPRRCICLLRRISAGLTALR